jgi:hypothetical protein
MNGTGYRAGGTNRPERTSQVSTMQREVGLSRWAACATLLAVALLTGACGQTGPSPSDEEVSAYTEEPPPKNEAVKFFLYTHCGAENARIGGRWWLVQPPLYGEHGEGDSPDSWDDPYQKGRLVLESSRRATFSAGGTEVVLVPSPNNEPLRICR